MTRYRSQGTRWRRGALALAVLAIALSALPALAQSQPRFTLPNLVIKIPGLSDFTEPEETQNCPEVAAGRATNCLLLPWIGQYLAGFYRFAVLAATILAAVVIMVAGFLWLTAGGNVTQIGTARAYIGGALLGLVLMLGSYTVLNLINPKLVTFEALRIPLIKRKELRQVQLISQAAYCRWEPKPSSPSPTFIGGTTSELCPSGTEFRLGSCDGIALPADASEGSHACCCERTKLIGYDLRGIDQRQTAHASPDLAELINRIQRNVPFALGINSISDDHLFDDGGCQPWVPPGQGQAYNVEPFATGCQHAYGSDHYGWLTNPPAGFVFTENTNGFSCAVDLQAASESVCDQIGDAIVDSDVSATATFENTPPHCHVSLTNCSGGG
jgi:hypothetical protein